MAADGISGIGGFSKISPSLFEISKPETSEESTVNFGDVLKNALNEVNDSQVQAGNIANDFAAGKIDDINSVMISAAKADLSLQFALQIRNKLLDAYNEIMRMQI